MSERVKLPKDELTERLLAENPRRGDEGILQWGERLVRLRRRALLDRARETTRCVRDAQATVALNAIIKLVGELIDVEDEG